MEKVASFLFLAVRKARLVSFHPRDRGMGEGQKKWRKWLSLVPEFQAERYQWALTAGRLPQQQQKWAETKGVSGVGEPKPREWGEVLYMVFCSRTSHGLLDPSGVWFLSCFLADEGLPAVFGQ